MLKRKPSAENIKVIHALFKFGLYITRHNQCMSDEYDFPGVIHLIFKTIWNQ